MLLKTLLKNSSAVGLAVAGAAIQAGYANTTVALAAAGAAVTTFLVLPSVIKFAKQIPDAIRSIRSTGSSALSSMRKKGTSFTNSVANSVNPADPDQNVLLGAAVGFLASEALASSLAPVVDAGIDAIPYVGKPTRVMLRQHHRLIADSAMTLVGAGAGFVFSDKRIRDNLKSTNTVLANHAASTERTSSPPPSGGVSGAINSAANAAAGAVSAAVGAITPKPPAKKKGN